MSIATLYPIDHPISNQSAGYERNQPVRHFHKPVTTEDLEREPDGVPHAVVGFTALFSVVLALLIGFMFLASPGTAVLLAAIAIPVLVNTLASKAERERDHLHPSR